MTSIGERAFYYSAVSSLELPSALQTLGKECFAGCGNLTEIAIPDELETIPESCFTGCKTLSSVTLPGNLKSIGQEAFGNCDGLEGITLPSGLESIDAFAFADCSSLKSITIPGSVRSIGEEAFVLCGNLSSVVIEEGLEELYGDVFSNCTSLTELTIPSSVTALEDFTEIEGVDMSNLIIRAEEGSTAAAFAEQNGVACIEPDDVLIGLSVDVSLLTKFTSVYTEGTAAEEIAGLFTVDPAYADEFAVDEARSGLAKIAGSEVSGIGSGSDLLDPAADYAVKIAVVPAEGTALPDVSQIAWKYNGKLTEPLLTETAGAGVNVYFHLGRPAEAAAGTLYQIKVNGGTANLAESVAGNVIIATPSAAPAGNKFTGWKVIAGDMETETAEDGTVRFIMPEGDVELTAEYSAVISLIGVKNVWKTPEAGKPVAFSAAVDSSINGIAEKISIEEETWQSDDQASVIKKSSSAIPEVGKTYSYSLTLKAKEGYVFDDGFTFILDSMMIPCRYELIGGGKEIVISGIVPDVKITWDLADTEIAELRSYTYSGTARKPAVTITKDGAALVKGTDFTVSYKNNINAGTAQAVIKGKGNYSGTVTKTFKINAKKVTPKVTLKAAAYVFNGKVKTPSVTVKAGTVTLVKGTDYTVTYASGRKNVGTYKVTVKLKGNYSGSKAVSFKINPKGTTLSTVTAASKGFTAKWNKQTAKMASSVITGYQIQYSRSSTFATGNKTVTVKGYKNISKKITGLKAGKKYYVRIRTYKTVSGKPYYSAWSAKKSVTTAK